MNNEQRIQQLEQRVKDLMAWKDQKTKQQLSYPLDEVSKEVLRKDFLYVYTTKHFIGGVSGKEFNSYLVKQGALKGSVQEDTSVTFTVDTSTDILTTQVRSFSDGDTVYVTTSDTLPSPLDWITTYYVVSSTGTSFKLSLTFGGAAINITTAGTGVHYIDYI